MPKAPARPCKKPGCNKLTRNKDGFCDDHPNWYQKQNDERRGTANERGYDAEWRRIRRRKLQEAPLCERCQSKGEIRPAVLVHHKDRDSRNRDWVNLESLCKDCHDEEHKGERWQKRLYQLISLSKE